MCGIFGVAGGHISGIDKEYISDLLAHRGPDGHNNYSTGNIFLAHSRLSIIDVAGGSQPMTNEVESLIITQNGEIYNYRELRQELEQKGVTFRTSSDTEVLLQSYALWGKDCLKRIRGMFAFAIADLTKNTLFLARDHFGIKPLVYSFSGKHFSFASEIQALASLPWVKNGLEPNPQAIYELLRFAYSSAPHSAFKQIFKLPPAHYIEIDLNFPSEIVEPVRYWDLSFDPDYSLSAEDCEELVDYEVRESVKAHLVSDVPFGAFLSGGLDSTLVVSYMNEFLADPVRSFSIGFTNKNLDERKYARIAAKILHTDHYEEVVTIEGLDLIPELVRHFGEPFGDSSAVPTWYVSRLARSHVPMVLSGDGGDEFFAGYKTYRKLLKQIDPITQKPQIPIWKHRARALLTKFLPKRFQPRAPIPKTFLDRWTDLMVFYKSVQMEPLLSKEFISSIDLKNPTMSDAFEKVSGHPSLSIARYIDINSYLPGDILTKVDIASMMHGLEVRTPLVDIRVAELSGRIPWDKLVEKRARNSDWVGKIPFRKILSSKFDASFIDRPKQGFSIPAVEWLFKNPERSKKVAARILSPHARINNWLNPSAVADIYKKKQGYQTWHLLVLEEWLEQHGF